MTASIGETLESSIVVVPVSLASRSRSVWRSTIITCAGGEDVGEHHVVVVLAAGLLGHPQAVEVAPGDAKRRRDRRWNAWPRARQPVGPAGPASVPRRLTWRRKRSWRRTVCQPMVSRRRRQCKVRSRGYADSVLHRPSTE